MGRHNQQVTMKKYVRTGLYELLVGKYRQKTLQEENCWKRYWNGEIIEPDGLQEEAEVTVNGVGKEFRVWNCDSFVLMNILVQQEYQWEHWEYWTQEYHQMYCLKW